LLGLVSLSVAYPSYIYVEDPEQIASVESSLPLTSERFEIRPRATKKNLIGPAVNGHMLKQPLLRFDILWRKFAPNSKRSFEP
ncbi:hypothetical protein PENTCL1PPCAC_28543, partial [Pristionchus entomophagus]